MTTQVFWFIEWKCKSRSEVIFSDPYESKASAIKKMKELAKDSDVIAVRILKQTVVAYGWMEKW